MKEMNAEPLPATRAATTWSAAGSCLAVSVMLACIAAPAQANTKDGLSKTYERCSTKATTWYDAVQCMDKERARLQQQLQPALSKRLGQIKDPGQQERAKQSQSHWEKHLEAECESLRGPDSGNATDTVTECYMLKTARRIMELESGTR